MRQIVKPSQRAHLLKKIGKLGMSPSQQQERRREIQFMLNLERIKQQSK